MSCSDERVAQCERAITDLTRRLEALEARSPGAYSPEPINPWPRSAFDRPEEED